MKRGTIKLWLLAALGWVLAVLAPGGAARAAVTCPSAAVGETLNITTSGGVTTCTNIGTAKATEGIEIYNNLFLDFITSGFGGARFGVAVRKVTSSGNEQPVAAACVGACFSFQPGDVFDEDTPIASSGGVAADWGYGTGTVTLVQCAAWSYSSSNAAGCTVSFQFADGTSGSFGVPGGNNTMPSFSVDSNIVTPLLSIVSGSGQSVGTSRMFASPLKLKLVNQSTLAPLAGWSVNVSRPSISNASAYLYPSNGGSDGTVFATDANGEISLRAYATAIAGSYVIKASVVGGNEVSFNLSNTGPHSFTIATGSTPQSAQVNTDFTNPIGGLVKDNNGDAAAGVGVTFSGPASGATAYLYEAGGTNPVASTVTDANGRFSLRARANGLTDSYTIRATVPGVGTFDYVLTNARFLQTITFTSTPPLPPAPGTTYPVAATGGASGNPVTFSIDASSTAGACTIAGATVSFGAQGTCIINANQAGNSDYASAALVQQTVSVGKAAQTITFTQPAGLVFKVGAIVPLKATASSSLTVSFASTTPAVCTVSGATATIVSVGTCTVKASQAGSATIAAAPDVTVSFAVASTPSVSATAVVTPDKFSRPGETLTFVITLSNGGSTTATGIKLVEPRLTGITCAATTLAAGANLTCQGTTQTTAADLAAGKISISPQLTYTYAEAAP